MAGQSTRASNANGVTGLRCSLCRGVGHTDPECPVFPLGRPSTGRRRDRYWRGGLFEEIAESEELEEHTKEVDTAVAEAQNEHAALESFAAVGDADTTNPFLAASEQFQ